ncbi:hypothetical protein E4T42_00748 [Aureobasidium subglaciale]|nr:hypothetical protein E4T42_00748 [Aureobasidium subglaciale]
MRDGLDGFDIECNQPVGGDLKARGPFGRERNIKPACLLQGGPTIGPDQFILDIHHPASSSSSQSRITQVSLAVIETLSSLPQAYSAEHHYRTNYTSLLLYTHPAAPPTLQYHHISLTSPQARTTTLARNHITRTRRPSVRQQRQHQLPEEDRYFNLRRSARIAQRYQDQQTESQNISNHSTSTMADVARRTYARNDHGPRSVE